MSAALRRTLLRAGALAFAAAAGRFTRSHVRGVLAVAAAFAGALAVTFAVAGAGGEPKARSSVGSLAAPIEGSAPGGDELPLGGAEGLPALGGAEALPALAVPEVSPAPAQIAPAPAPSAPAPAPPAPRKHAPAFRPRHPSRWLRPHPRPTPLRPRRHRRPIHPRSSSTTRAEP
jgi:hypothetical protein